MLIVHLTNAVGSTIITNGHSLIWSILVSFLASMTTCFKDYLFSRSFAELSTHISAVSVQAYLSASMAKGSIKDNLPSLAKAKFRSPNLLTARIDNRIQEFSIF